MRQDLVAPSSLIRGRAGSTQQKTKPCRIISDSYLGGDAEPIHRLHLGRPRIQHYLRYLKRHARKLSAGDTGYR